MNRDNVIKFLTRNIRIPIYLSLIVICSLVSITEDYKIDKKSLLNQWFVKLGWFWTCALVLPILFSNIRSDDKESVSHAIFRITLSTILWYVSVNLFQYLDVTTGFDVSGHTFLLIFSNLLITSELKLYSIKLKLEPRNAIRPIEFDSLTLPLYMLTILWDFMLIQTALYYHTILQKAIAAAWAIGSWLVLHMLFYRGARSDSKSLIRSAMTSIKDKQ